MSRIEHGVFSRNQLNSITLSEGITYIDSQAFANNKLTSITMATSIKNIGDGAFYHQDAPYGSGTIY
ncbi:leucine-rich repeat protein [Candidatus Peregrinibacteria bacterium]|nr:leucine-rich repeat protein [Candidatus Peregrinibacteria bacterium]